MRHETINKMFEELYDQRQETEQKMNTCERGEFLECVICLRAIEYEINFLERIECEENQETTATREGRIPASVSRDNNSRDNIDFYI